MRKFNWRTMVSVILLSLLSAANQSCRKTDAVTKQADEEQLAAQASGHINALPHTKQYGAEVATEWFTLLTEITRTKPYFSPQSLRIFAYSGMALYESVVPGMPSYQSMYKHFTGNIIEVDHKKNYYWPASANAAMARIASRIMQNYPAPNLAPVQALEASLNASFQAQVTPEQLQFSNEFGRYVADMIYDWSKTDGTLNPNGTLAVCPLYSPLGGPGNWVPTPPAFFPAAGACQGSLRTFIPNIVTTILASPHSAYSTAPGSVFYQAAQETYQFRNNITTEETRQFNNWRDAAPNYNPLAHMLLISTNIIIKEKLNLEEAATLYAKQTIAASDVIGAVFHSKFHYSLMRPVTYIRGVLGHSTWSSLPITPQTPSYPDELAATASSVAILENYFGTNYSFVDDIHKATHGEWSYSSLNEMLSAIIQARVSGGTIFRFAGEAGVIQGRLAGNMVNRLPFKKE